MKQSESLPVSHDLPENTYDHLFRQIRSLLNGSNYEEAKKSMGRIRKKYIIRRVWTTRNFNLRYIC
jgi:outer membrane protein assembly factor BamD (BamD/ComL family)